MSYAPWARKAEKVLGELTRTLPRDADEATVKKAVFDAYPFGRREYDPYKTWLRKVKEWKAERAKLRAWQGTP